MENYFFLLSIAIILLATKSFGLISAKVNMPQVVGALFAGLILGPSILGIIEPTDFLEKCSEIGVIILMFMAGLDTKTDEIKKSGASYVLIALLGVLLPLIGGFLCYFFFFDVDMSNKEELLKALFIGVVLTATSVSITVETLRELGKLDSKIGNAVVAAAVIDDVLGIIILTFITSMKNPSVSLSAVFLKIILYTVLMAVLYVILNIFKDKINALSDISRLSIYVFSFVLIISFVSERYFGITDITGAYLIGVFLSSYKIKPVVAKKINVPSYLFFSPIFFASIGIKTQVDQLNTQLLIFSVIILVVAILTKIVGCGFGAMMFKYDLHEAVNVGIGMVSRGEVALIVAQKGHDMGLLDTALFSPIVLVVIVTTIITPIMLKVSLRNSTVLPISGSYSNTPVIESTKQVS